MADTNYQYLTNAGVVIPDTGSILTEVENEFKAVFGDDLVVTPDTPQGVLIAAETAARKAVVNNNAALANQINPDVAGGAFLDAIWALMGGQRTVATRSTVYATLSGVPGAIISAGAQAKTTGGDLFELIDLATIGQGGTVDAQFQSVEYGPIPCPAGALATIVDNVIGWETVSNSAAASLGSETQSDMSARRDRRNTLAFYGAALPEAIVSAVYSVPGVTSVAFRENITNLPQEIDGVTLKPHSIYVCADGGADGDVAGAILANKPLGAGMNGDSLISVTEPVSGQKYNVQFQRPEYVPVLVRVTVRQGGSIADPRASVVDAILRFASGELTSDSMIGICDDVNPWELSGAINQAYPSIYVAMIEVKKAGGNDFQSSPLAIDLWQRAVFSEQSIQVLTL